MPRTVIGMSGGVDSSLAAAMVAADGHEAVGVTLKLWPCAELDGGFTRPDACCSPGETIDARSVARGLALPHYVVDAEAAFQRRVVDDFTAAYARGETPNPCVRCNEHIKFGVLWDHARSLGASRLATGHYARIAEAFDRRLPRRAVDRDKDQSYFLFSLSQEQLAAAAFPVGSLTKEEVRERARALGLATADKAESMDLCFVGRDVAGFLRRHLPDAFRPGDIRHVDGRLLGEHQGLAGVTVGQRKGLGVAWSEPLYVVRVDAARNTVELGPRTALLADRLELRACTWHLGPLPREGLDCRVRLRHRGAAHPARVVPTDAGAQVRFPEPVARAAPGQACVAYDLADDHCLGGGWIAA